LRKCRELLKEFFDSQIGPNTEAAVRGRPGLTLVGTGGTTTILARMEKQLTGFHREEIEAASIRRERIAFWMDLLWRLPLAERKQITGIPANRADILPFGVAIYEAVMDHFGMAEVFVSTRGLRFGALLY